MLPGYDKKIVFDSTIIMSKVISLVEDESTSESECCCFIRTICCMSTQNEVCCSEDDTFIERGDRTPEQVMTNFQTEDL